MGAPKQKWTAEEEAALKAAIQKHGTGKWSLILKDPEFGDILKSRSNVDLKDKWRNLCCMATGSGSRSKSNILNKSTQSAPKHAVDVGKTAEDVGAIVHNEVGKLFDINITTAVDHGKDVAGTFENLIINSAANHSAVIAVEDNIGDMVEEFGAFDVKNHVAVDATPLSVDASTIVRFDDLILEAIAKSKEPRGSSQRSVAKYIEGNCSAPPDLKRILPMNLKLLIEEERIIKVREHYRLAPKSVSSNKGKEPPGIVPKLDFAAPLGSNFPSITKAQIDAELEKIRNIMTPQEAAAFAAKAVAEAESAIALAEAAAKEAEEAEAKAETARLFAEASDKSSTYFGIFSTW